MGKTRKKKTRENFAGREKEKEGSLPPLSPVSSRFIFVFALSQFSGPDYLGAWNRLGGERWKLFFSPACRARSRVRVKARPNPRGKKNVCGQVNEQWNILDSIDSVWIGRCNSRANSSDCADHENENNSFWELHNSENFLVNFLLLFWVFLCPVQLNGDYSSIV